MTQFFLSVWYNSGKGGTGVTIEFCHTWQAEFFFFFFFFLRDFIFKKTLFEKLQYLKEEQYLKQKQQAKLKTSNCFWHNLPFASFALTASNIVCKILSQVSLLRNTKSLTGGEIEIIEWNYWNYISYLTTNLTYDQIVSHVNAKHLNIYKNTIAIWIELAKLCNKWHKRLWLILKKILRMHYTKFDETNVQSILRIHYTKLRTSMKLTFNYMQAQPKQQS